MLVLQQKWVQLVSTSVAFRIRPEIEMLNDSSKDMEEYEKLCWKMAMDLL